MVEDVLCPPTGPAMGARTECHPTAHIQTEVCMSNIFVLCTGRCGSVTFSRAARHIRNYTSGHESRAQLVGPARMAYPPNHIEADNRLSWLLGRLDEDYGPNARYVHLTRDSEAVARSFSRRWGEGIIAAYQQGILEGSRADRMAICRDYVETVTSNIRAFLDGKPEVMRFELETAPKDWRRFWDWIGAEGDFDASLAEWHVPHNSSMEQETWMPNKVRRLVRRVRSGL